jgi:hypothetical protein
MKKEANSAVVGARSFPPSKTIVRQYDELSQDEDHFFSPCVFHSFYLISLYGEEEWGSEKMSSSGRSRNEKCFVGFSPSVKACTKISRYENSICMYGFRSCIKFSLINSLLLPLTKRYECPFRVMKFIFMSYSTG